MTRDEKQAVVARLRKTLRDFTCPECGRRWADFLWSREVIRWFGATRRSRRVCTFCDATDVRRPGGDGLTSS